MKGTMTDLFFIIIFLFLVAISFILAYMFLDKFETQINGMNTTFNTTYIDQGKASLGMMNYLFLFVLFSAFAAAVIGAFMLDTHPIFAVVSIIMLVVIVMVGAVFANIYQEIMSDSNLISYATTEFNIITWVFMNLPFILVVFAVVLMIVMYGKSAYGVRL